MSVRGWGGAVGAAVGIAAGAGAAQAGLGYGLGVVGWLPAPGTAGEPAWVASLTWAIWIAATSTVAGALGAARLRGGTAAGFDTVRAPGAVETADATDTARTTDVVQSTDTARTADTVRTTSTVQSTDTARTADVAGPPDAVAAGAGRAPVRWPWRGALAVGAAVGAAVTVALIAVPAREATGVAGPGAQSTAAGYALAGVALGLLLAVWALASPAVARNLVATVGWLWALAVATVVASVVTGRRPTGAPLGSWPDWATGSGLSFRGHVFWPAAALSLGAALVLGALAAWSVARRPRLRVGATVSGGAGPALVAAAHLIAPAPDGISPEQLSAQLTAAYAVIAGLAGSALVAGFAQGRATRQGRTEPAVIPADPRTGSPEPAAGTAAPTTGRTRPATGPAGGGVAGGVPDQRSSPDRRE